MKLSVFLSIAILVFLPCGIASAGETPAVEEKVFQSGIITYEPTPDEIEYGKIDPGFAPDKQGKLECEADVRYPNIEARFRYTDYVNQRFKMLADAQQCSRDLSFSSLKPKITFFQGPVISIMFHVGELPRGGNGSCHGGWQYMTFDLETGKEYALADFLYAKDFSDIRASIIEAFEKQGLKTKTVERILDEKFWSLGFYIENGKIFVDMNDFLVGCAAGNHYPAEIDSKFIHEKYENHSVFSVLNAKP